MKHIGERRSLLQDERGLIGDLPYIIVFLFTFFIVIMFLHRAYTEVNDQIRQTSGFGNSTVALDSLTRGQAAINGLDFIFVMAMVLLFLGLIVSAFFLDSHPIFFFMFLTIIVGLVIIAGILGNVANTLLADPQLENETGTYPMIGYVFDNYPIYILVAIVIVVIIFYAKARQALG